MGVDALLTGGGLAGVVVPLERALGHRVGVRRRDVAEMRRTNPVVLNALVLEELGAVVVAGEVRGGL